jgi:hypothetical protein
MREFLPCLVSGTGGTYALAASFNQSSSPRPDQEKLCAGATTRQSPIDAPERSDDGLALKQRHRESVAVHDRRCVQAT